MPRIGIFNMCVGFGILFVSAAAGAFVANDMTNAFIHDQELLKGWQMILSRSAHGHFNLFGMIHILFGLTVPYSYLSSKTKGWQTIGLMLGALAIGPGLFIKGYVGPSSDIDLVSVLIGACLSCALAALAAHAAGLAGKFMARS